MKHSFISKPSVLIRRPVPLTDGLRQHVVGDSSVTFISLDLVPVTCFKLLLLVYDARHDL